MVGDIYNSIHVIDTAYIPGPGTYEKKSCKLPSLVLKKRY